VKDGQIIYYVTNEGVRASEFSWSTYLFAVDGPAVFDRCEAYTTKKEAEQAWKRRRTKSG